jgi:hypothetical protein
MYILISQSVAFLCACFPAAAQLIPKQHHKSRVSRRSVMWRLEGGSASAGHKATGQISTTRKGHRQKGRGGERTCAF